MTKIKSKFFKSKKSLNEFRNSNKEKKLYAPIKVYNEFPAGNFYQRKLIGYQQDYE